jgi:adenylate kinase family enzyme
VQRVSVVGSSGSGKSTVSAAIAQAIGGAHIEVDGLYHQPGWTELPADQLRAAVDERTRGDRWVVDGNYSVVTDLVWSRADTVVWLDLPRSLVMRQVVARTLRRLVAREELWNRNRERWREVLRVDPQRSIIRWAWTTHGESVERFTARLADPRWAQLDVARLRSRSAVDAFLADLD